MTVLLLAPLVKNLPNAALGAIVIVAVLGILVYLVSVVLPLFSGASLSVAGQALLPHARATIAALELTDFKFTVPVRPGAILIGTTRQPGSDDPSPPHTPAMPSESRWAPSWVRAAITPGDSVALKPNLNGADIHGAQIAVPAESVAVTCQLLKEAGASEVFTHGFARNPRARAFCATKPAPISINPDAVSSAMRE